jgi:hypothetical protein
LSLQISQAVDFDSFNIFQGIAPAGQTVRVTEKTPRGRRRVITFGFLTLVGGNARNLQLAIIDDANRDVQYPVSGNDTNAKGLMGYQVLNEGQYLVAIVAADGGSTNTDLKGSISYFDYIKPQMLTNR